MRHKYIQVYASKYQYDHQLLIYITLIPDPYSRLRGGEARGEWVISGGLFFPTCVLNNNQSWIF